MSRDSCPSDAAIIARLNLGDSAAKWISRFETLPPPEPISAPDPGALSLLGLSPEDAQEVLTTLPSEERDPDLWWLLTRSRQLLAEALTSQWKPGSIPLPVPPQFGLFAAHLIWISLGDIRACHRGFGVPDDISWETLAYLGRAMAACRSATGNSGVQLSGWDWLRFYCWLYQVGRLQVTPYWLCTHPKEAGPLFWYEDAEAERLGLPFRTGDFALAIHVPPTEPLAPEACEASLRRLGTGFRAARIATCTSWLLDEQLNEYLPSDSNILAFQHRFRLVPGSLESDQVMLRAAFGAEYSKDLESLPQNTALQRAAVAHLQRGGNWYTRTGWLEL